MADQQPTGTPAAKPSRAFAAGAWFLVLMILVCGFFAGMAGKKIGPEHTMFVISFVFLGIVVVAIFALAWVDANTRGPDQGQRHH